MKKKHTAEPVRRTRILRQSGCERWIAEGGSAPARHGFGERGFSNLCISLGVLVFFVGVLLALFAAAKPVSFTGEGRPNREAQIGRSNGMPFAPLGGVYPAWLVRYNGPANGYDGAFAIAIDASGNVYVTGESVSPTTGADYLTIKYNANGQQEWVALYDGGGAYGDVATAIAVDDFGNIYVTGHSWGTANTNSDYATVKYDSAGQQEWVARYDGPAHDYDSPTAIAVDGSGNIYVTGTSTGLGTGPDCVTIKYSAAGQQQWVARYNSPGNGNDGGAAIVIDDLGNIYVAGYSVTIKYNSAGQEQWIANGAALDIATDGKGNLYVTGESLNPGNGFDCVTTKYDSTGEELWVARYDGPAHRDEYADGIAVDGLGNISVTGASYASANDVDYFTVSYSASGQQRWVARYDAGVDDWAAGVTVDTLGNTYVTGRSGPFGNDDYATIKYDSLGHEQWVGRYNGPGNGQDYAYGIAVDQSGNVYVTGTSLGLGTGSSDCATIKYGPAGATPTPTATVSPTPTSTPVECQLSEEFDQVTPPVLPPGWTAINAIDPDGILWQTSNSGNPTPPADSPPNAAWVNDPPVVSDKRFDSPPVRIDILTNAVVIFRSNYALENGFDGGVLEISIDGGPFQDIIAAGGHFLQGGYNGTISSCCGNPLAGRQAWTGSSGGFITTQVDMFVFRGHTSVLRWRMASDSSTSSQGWRIDTVQLICERPTPTATPTLTATPTATATATSTATASSTATPTATATSTQTPPPTPSPTPPEPSVTPSPTPTTTPTPTAAPRISPTPRLQPTPAPRP